MCGGNVNPSPLIVLLLPALLLFPPELGFFPFPSVFLLIPAGPIVIPGGILAFNKVVVAGAAVVEGADALILLLAPPEFPIFCLRLSSNFWLDKLVDGFALSLRLTFIPGTLMLMSRPFLSFSFFAGFSFMPQ
jgi:hypothetical protein